MESRDKIEIEIDEQMKCGVFSDKVLLSGVNISDVPRCIRWIALFSEDEELFQVIGLSI